MKKHTTRIVSLALVLVLLTAIFSGLTVTGAAVSYNFNTGNRHTLCTSLSTQAVTYYNTNGIVLDQLCALSGDSTGSSIKGMTSPLYQKLQTLMKTTKTFSSTYSRLTSYWPYTDASNGKSGVQLFYSDTVGTGYNREHVWPKSRGSFYQTNAGSDLQHLRPTNTNVNSTRGNYTMGNVRKVCSTYSTYDYGGKTVLYYNAGYGTSFNGETPGLVEVNDNIKGDVARILLYVYVTWGQPNLFQDVASSSLPAMDSDDSANNGVRVINDLDTLLNWMEIDPVDTWEMSRNDITQSIQGNRNVFIDYPEMAWLLFAKSLPGNYDTPSGYAKAHGDPCAAGHTWGAWVQTAAPTCTETGTETRTCSVCNKTESRTVAALGHNWDSGVVTVTPTATEPGILVYTCYRCHQTKSETIPATACDGGDSCPGKNFSDMPAPSNWAHVGIDYVLSHHIFSGTTSKTFSPAEPMTRAMLVTVLWAMDNKTPATVSASFSDVPEGKYYTASVSWAAERGIVSGIGNGKFNPNGNVTREQIAIILLRYAAYQKYALSDGVSLSGYPDSKDVSDYAVSALSWAVGAKLISGTVSGTSVLLDPKGSATRAQVAAMLMQFVHHIAET